MFEAVADAGLGGEVDDAVANLVVAQLLFCEATDPERDIQLYINSPGGSVTAGMAIYDTMQYIRPQVSTVCVGMAASMGADDADCAEAPTAANAGSECRATVGALAIACAANGAVDRAAAAGRGCAAAGEVVGEASAMAVSSSQVSMVKCPVF